MKSGAKLSKNIREYAQNNKGDSGNFLATQKLICDIVEMNHVDKKRVKQGFLELECLIDNDSI